MTTVVMFVVTVPARLQAVTRAKAADLDASTDSDVHSVGPPQTFAKNVREFIVNNPDCEWISEDPTVNGKAWWVSFHFSCKESSAEICIAGLHHLGIGVDGKGMIHVLPVSIHRVGSRPKTFGRSAPYSTTHTPLSSPPSSPVVSTRKSVTISQNVSVIEIPKEEIPPPTSEEFIDLEYGDGIEVEDEDELFQAQLMAELEKSKEKDPYWERYAGNFPETIKSRIAVDAIIRTCQASSEFSFDYVMLVVIAGVISCIGLVTDNSVTIVASMLVSPLMGPILAVTFGAVVSDRPLMKRGAFAECMGLLLCIVVGFIGGLCSAPCNGETWPTEQMASRSEVSALWIGAAIAIPSGLGAALSVLGNNTSSLVGVAISASLLPPAVNAGVFLAASALHNTSTVFDYHEHLPEAYTTQTWVGGAVISFCLTIINIICIWLAAYSMFELKEVKSDSMFWKKDVKNARHYNQSIRQSTSPTVSTLYQRAFDAAKRKTHDVGQALSPFEKLGWKSS